MVTTPTVSSTVITSLSSSVVSLDTSSSSSPVLDVSGDHSYSPLQFSSEQQQNKTPSLPWCRSIIITSITGDQIFLPEYCRHTESWNMKRWRLVEEQKQSILVSWLIHPASRQWSRETVHHHHQIHHKSQHKLTSPDPDHRQHMRNKQSRWQRCWWWRSYCSLLMFKLKSFCCECYKVEITELYLGTRIKVLNQNISTFHQQIYIYLRTSKLLQILYKILTYQKINTVLIIDNETSVLDNGYKETEHNFCVSNILIYQHEMFNEWSRLLWNNFRK